MLLSNEWDISELESLPIKKIDKWGMEQRYPYGEVEFIGVIRLPPSFYKYPLTKLNKMYYTAMASNIIEDIINNGGIRQKPAIY